jgi:hypothetical protein
MRVRHRQVRAEQYRASLLGPDQVDYPLAGQC